MHKKKNLLSLFTALFAVLIFICAFICATQTAAYATSTSSETIDFGTDGITVDDLSRVNELITELGGTSYDDLSTQLDSGAKNATNFTSAKTVTLGGVEFNIMYVSKADYTKNGTNGGDIIVTLWAAESDIESQWNRDSTNNPDAKYPMNMYSSSLIHSTLVGGNYLMWDGDEALDGTGVINDAWKPFNAGGAFYNYLATPANMAWQETLSAAQEVGFDNNCPNEAWGTPGSGSFADYFDFSLKEGYADWKNDRIWLPAISETGGRNSSNGLWNTNQTQRSNTSSASWLRSAAADEGMYAYYLNAAGAGYIGLTLDSKAVRPAIHLNLTSLYKFEVTVNDTKTKYLTIEEAFSAANSSSSSATFPTVFATVPTVKMLDDAETTDTLTVESGKNITLDLNGHMLKYTGDDSKSVITVDGGNLTLKDSNTQAAHKYNINDDGLWVFNDSGTETLSGGVISGGKASGVYVCGFAANWNASVSFTMENGNICGNTATEGGGVNVRDDGHFTMSGGKICGNTATNGGGVYSNGNYTSMLNILGGTISGNAASENVGGVGMFGGYLFSIGGAPAITGNKVNGNDNNIYSPYIKIKVADELTEGAQIGINNAGVVATNFEGDDPSKYFIPDDPANDCVYVSDEESGTVYIGTHTGGTATCTVKAECSNCGKKYGEFDDTNHDPDDTVWLVNTENGTHYHACQNGCGEELDAAAHVYNQEVVNETYLKSAATCTAKALYYKSCVCGEHGTETFENGELASHTSAEAVRENEVAANCTQAGSYVEVVYCSVCGEEISRTEKPLAINETAHAWGEWTVAKEATETEEGEERRVCANNDTHFETRPIPKVVVPDNGDGNGDNSQDGLSAGAIAGIVIACILLALLILYIVCYFALYCRDILLKGKFFDAIYVPMNAIFGKKEQEEENS